MIICCGEALIDLIPTGSGPAAPHVGGSVLNTAVSLGRLGVPVALMTGLSSDAYGQQIEAHLHSSHVDCAFAIRSDRPTTLAIVTLENGQARYRFEDEGSAMRMIGIDDLPALPEDVQAMVFGGISLIAPPAADALAHLCVSRRPDILAMLDANVRPDFVEDPAPYRARLTRMLRASDIVKVSDEDLEWLTDGAADVEGAVSDLLQAGPAMVLVTRGADGATGYRQGAEPVHVAAHSVEVIDTVGAGDTFNGGFLAALRALGCLGRARLLAASAADVAAALDYAAQAAAVTVSRPGADPPWQHELGAINAR